MQDSSLSVLQQRIRRSFKSKDERFHSYDSERDMAWGHEMRQAGARYYWDGKQRGTPVDKPRVLFQFTLEGIGEYEEDNKYFGMRPGSSFTVLMPSDHRYYLPEGSPRWGFFWLFLRHPFVIERVQRLRQQEAAVQNWEKDSPVIEAAVSLFEAASAGHLREVWNFEEMLFSWLLKMERELYHRRYPRDERQRLLDETRAAVMGRLQRPWSASELAEANQMERTTFSRKFKATTGRSPAAFTTEVRLEEALKLLRTEAKLEEIAARTGFADANHFCKVFRRHFHSSPGSYRRVILKR